MSSFLNAYAVSIVQLEKTLGSGKSVWKSIAKRSRGYLSTIDDIDDDVEVRAEDAVKQLVLGELDEDVPPYLYGYALEAICRYAGETLPDVASIVGASDWIEEVDAVLGSQNVPLSLGTLVHAGPPVAIPEPDDYPFIGYWTPDQIAKAEPLLRHLDPHELDAEMADIMVLLHKWTKTALKRRGRGIVGFLS